MADADARYLKLTAAHAEAYSHLRLEGTRLFPLGFLVTPEEVEALSLEGTKQRLEAGHMRGVVAGGVVLGFCGYRPGTLTRTRHSAEIGPVYVTPDAQGTGAADVMMSGVIDEAREDGVSLLTLFVDTENHRALSFYKRFGFEIEATHRGTVTIDGVSRDDYYCVLSL